MYILQRWDAKWNTYVDVSDIEQVVNGDRLICTLQDGLQDSQAGSQCSALSTVDRKRDTRDFDTAKGKVSFIFHFQIKHLHPLMVTVGTV